MVKSKIQKPLKLVVFDLDETIGAFPALSGVLYSMQPLLQNYPLFKHYLDTNPTYLRPYILDILKQVYEAKRVHGLVVVLYTNNSNSFWISMILYYINTVLNVKEPIFDHVLDASQHTDYNKNVEDLLRRTRLLNNKGKNAQIFFVDDQYHPDMITPQTVYFHITPYKTPNARDVGPSQQLFKELRTFINS